MSYPYYYRSSYEFSVPAGTASGVYYWTNAYVWGSGYSRPTSDPAYNMLNAAASRSVSEGCTVERWQTVSWFGTGSYANEQAIAEPGGAPGADRVLVLDIARLTASCYGGGRWYKRVRGLLAPRDIAGGLLSDEIVSYLGAEVLPRLAAVPLYNWRGNPVGAIVVAPAVYGWQMRHGTKRAARRVLLPLP